MIKWQVILCVHLPGFENKIAAVKMKSCIGKVSMVIPRKEGVIF